MTTSHWLRQYSSKSSDISTDILIVGGGYIGLSTAYWLTHLRPDLRVTVLERTVCGSGASGRNAGFLTMGSASFYRGLCNKWGTSSAREIFNFAADSLDLVHQHILKVSPEIKFERTSSMTLFRSEDQLTEWKKSGFKAELFNFNWVDESALPIALKSRFYGGFEVNPEYKVNPIQLLGSLRKLLEKRKVQIIENSSAFELHPEGISTEINFIRAKQVILALNGYFPQFHKAFKDAIIPRRAQMLAVEFEEDFECPSLYYDPPERVYWRTTQDKLLVIGGKRLIDEEGEVGDFEKISPKIQHALEDYLRDYLRLTFRVINRWSGTMGFTEHELPLVGKIAAPLEAYVIGGFSGHGMGLGFRSGLDMAQLALGESKDSFFSKFKKPAFNL